MNTHNEMPKDTVEEMESGWREEFIRYYGALLNKPTCCEMRNNDCGCDGDTYLNEITDFIAHVEATAYNKGVEVGRVEERERVRYQVNQMALAIANDAHDMTELQVCEWLSKEVLIALPDKTVSP
jgi:hypothetical protein